ncbi:MAG: DNA-binding protein [Thermoprotei archaeon]|nr:MAG: DNA-binding protein [Thermoprotei archaeon]
MSRWALESERWFEQALENLRAAEDILRAGHYAWSCFLSQQAAKCALKSAFYLVGVERFGHSILDLLLDLSSELNLDASDLLDSARLLDRHYAAPRYANMHPHTRSPPYKLYGRGDAERCLSCARTIVEFVRNLRESLTKRR